jgi:hypothetical protein
MSHSYFKALSFTTIRTFYIFKIPATRLRISIYPLSTPPGPTDWYEYRLRKN